jgi:hypothetical protein
MLEKCHWDKAGFVLLSTSHRAAVETAGPLKLRFD